MTTRTGIHELRQDGDQVFIPGPTTTTQDHRTSAGTVNPADIAAAVAADPTIARTTELNTEKARIDAHDTMIAALDTSQAAQDTSITALQAQDIASGAQKTGDATKLELTRTGGGTIEIDVSWLQGDPDGTTSFEVRPDNTVFTPPLGNDGDAYVITYADGSTDYLKQATGAWTRLDPPLPTDRAIMSLPVTGEVIKQHDIRHVSRLITSGTVYLQARIDHTVPAVFYDAANLNPNWRYIGQEKIGDMVHPAVYVEGEKALQDGIIYEKLDDGSSGAVFNGSLWKALGTNATADLALRELLANKVTSIRATGTADDTAYPTEKAVRDLFSSLQTLGQAVSPFGATQAALPAVPADASATTRYWTVQTADEIGTGDAANPQFPAGIYLSGNSQADGWAFGAALGTDVLELTQVQVESTTGADYSQFGLVSAERLDQWGITRRRRRIFNTSDANFDFTALNYPPRTAVFVRNINGASGMNITYGAGGANTLHITQASGQTNTVNGLDTFNVQPLEIVVMEQDGTDVYVSIFPAERVKNFTDAATANANGPVAHDSIVTTRDGLIGWRKTGFDNRLFPADGQSDTDWFVFNLSTGQINPDDITEWSATETDIAQGALRKITGTPTTIYGRIVADATADGGVAPDGAKWQDITDVNPNVLSVIDSTGGGNRFAVYGEPSLYEVTGSENITLLFPTDGGVNANLRSQVYNKGTGTVTIEGQELPAGGIAFIQADPDLGGPFVWVSGQATTDDWIFSTDGYAVQDGDKIILSPNHSLNWASTTDLEGFQLAPSTGNWSDIAGGTGSINPDAAWTFGSGQNLFFGSDIISAVNVAASTNVLLFSGGEDAPSQDSRYETVASLPDPTTVASGTGAFVFNDGVNSGAYVARGPAAANAVAWVK